MKVFLVEDAIIRNMIVQVIKYYLGNDTIVLVAVNLKEARDIFSKHQDFDFILMDLNLGNEVTFDLIREISQIYKGPIVATSTDVDKHYKMVESGCTHMCEKKHLHNFIKMFKTKMVKTK